MTWISFSRPSLPFSPEREPPELDDDKRPLALVVEDDPSIRRIVRRYLAELGSHVLEAENGRVARSLLAKLKPDLICLNLLLPEPSGYSLCEFIRSVTPLQQVPVLVMSARAMPQDRVYAEQVGATAFLAKPFTQGQFVQIVTSILEIRAPTVAAQFVRNP